MNAATRLTIRVNLVAIIWTIEEGWPPQLWQNPMVFELPAELLELGREHAGCHNQGKHSHIYVGRLGLSVGMVA